MTLRASLERARVLAILRRADIGEVVLDLFEQLHAAGVRAVEVTLDRPEAPDALRRLVGHAPPDTIVGAGTVLTTDQVDMVADAGGSFVVCPHVDPRLIERGLARGVPVVPGISTATEIVTARTAGAEVLKLFPAGPLGIPYLRALLGPFRDAAFVPTGGIAVDEVPVWIEAGAICVGLGGALVRSDGVDPKLGEVVRRVT
ncbi:MAG: bifunctional 4-hydroxy-2-oxoglutarate aldolase/2-dehydro-3-deoxy-phosphogluconate aldolase [Actinomycetota bacterium]